MTARNTTRSNTKPARRTGVKLEGDTWAVGMTGLGLAGDKSESTYFAARARLTPAQLEAMYDGDGTLGRIVDHPADEMTRADFEIKSVGATADASFDWASIKAQLDKQGALPKIGDAKRWARLYGGALLVFDVIDGRKPWQPVDMKSIKAIRDVTVVESPYATPVGAGWRVANPDVWQIGGNASTAIERVHKSRVVRFYGSRCSPSSLMREGNGWPPSVLEKVWRAVARMGTALGYAANIMHEMSLPVLKIANLRKTLKEPGGRAKIRDILKAIKDGMDILHMLAIDSEDDFADVTREARGIVEILASFEADVARQTDMPKEVIHNVTEGGLNTGTNAGPIRVWYDRITRQRDDEVGPALLTWIDFLIAARGKTKTAPEHEIVFEPLWEPTPAEVAAVALQRAQADQVYFTIGAVTSREIRTARFVTSNDGGFNVEADPLEADPLEAGELDPGAEVDPALVTPLEQADYEPTDRPEPASYFAERFGLSSARLRGMHKRKEIGGWKFGGGWSYSPSEVLKAGYRAPGSTPPKRAPIAPPIGPMRILGPAAPATVRTSPIPSASMPSSSSATPAAPGGV